MYVRTFERTYVRKFDDVMAIKQDFSHRWVTTLGNHIFLTTVIRAHAPSARRSSAMTDQTLVQDGADHSGNEFYDLHEGFSWFLLIPFFCYLTIN